MKKPSYLLLTGILCLMFSFIVSGQTPMEDVVYLKNGSVIRGTILEQIPAQSLKIQTTENGLFVFTMEEIKKVTREEIPAPKQNVASETTPSSSDTIYQGKKRKYYQNGYLLSGNELNTLLKTNPQAYAFKKTADGYYAGGTVLMCIGAATVAGCAFTTKNLNTTLIVGGIGLGIEIIGLLVSTGYYPNLKRAISTFNQGVKDKEQPTVSLNAGFTRNGLGITLDF